MIKVLRALQGDASSKSLLHDRARDSAVDALTHLAQGYHAYHLRDKIGHYSRSREMLCSAACLLAVLAGLERDGGELRGLSAEIQGDPLGAVTGLIRTLENRGKKRRQSRGEEEAPA